jgi:CHAT domain
MKQTILFLAANPSGLDRLALDREARAIQKELESAGYRDCFVLETRWATEPLDLLRELRKLKPTVVHFSGQGAADGQHLHGLFFQGRDGRAQFVSTVALEETFGAVGASVKVVVLNACYSETQAEALLAHVECVVGMSGAIPDGAARSFAIGFYGGLGDRESIAAAFRQGCAAISLEGLREGDRPQLKVHPGIDASRLVLAADPPITPLTSAPLTPEPSGHEAAGAPRVMQAQPGFGQALWRRLSSEGEWALVVIPLLVIGIVGALSRSC